ncbi:restriction endonuclease subunit S [Methanosphaerula palustris]|uniref:Restriction modification system DNA specificity subunit n=1 Tax=Methanosphaerula palustris (strain ATCC BAA-1556 / DSM 19958 / E1-9c) TaxID=521011 RepID=B8GH36_METPE|nr:restriction endonuclease subunit S [Methanosphaerula palustris]ACL16441.1 restriction modification system DNA specificity subunit [Methanosphaerula palustris E1-9c]
MTNLGVFPETWQIKKIGDLFNVQQGISMSPARRNGPNKHPFLRTLNVFWSGIDLKTLDYMDLSEKEIGKLNLLPGDLLVCEGGDIGRSAIWRGELESCGYQNHIHRLRVKNCDVYPEFVVFWMQAAIKILGFYQDEGNKTTIPNLSQSRLKNFDIPHSPNNTPSPPPSTPCRKQKRRPMP